MSNTENLVNINFDQAELERLTAEMDATAAQFERALARALRKMAAWLKAYSVRGLSRELDIQQKLLRKRLRTMKIKAGEGGGYGLWFGLDPIPYAMIATPVQAAAGVKAGRHFVKGAFVGRDKNGKVHVWKRFGPRVPYDGNNPRYAGENRQRLAEQRLDIQGHAQDWIERNLFEAPQFEEQFFKFFEHELKFASKIEPTKNFFR